KRRQRRLLDAERTQAVPCKSNGDPALLLLDRIPGLRGRLRSLENRREPGPAPGGIPKRQKLVPAGEGRRASQKHVLDVIEFEHDGSPSGSLHLVEHLPERRFQLERLLDLVGADIRILAVLEKARTLVLADEFDEGGSIRLPVFRKAFEILEDGVHA